MTRSHMPFQYMKQFKAVAMDWEYYQSLEDCERLYRLTDQQVYILLVQLEYVGWLTRWYNTSDITQKTVELIKSSLMQTLMECVDISVLVDQGKLRLSRDVQQQQIESQRLREDYEEEYTGDPTSINPSAPTIDFGATGERFDALCAALTALVYQFANYQIQAIVAGDAAAFALLAGAAILLIPGLNLFFIAGAAIALIAGGGIIGVTTATAVNALSDTDALGNVICFMRDTLKAQTVTQANFAACLDTYPWGIGTNEAIIADFIKPTLSDNYLPFLDMLGNGYDGVMNDQPIPECPCEPPPPQEFHFINYPGSPSDCTFTFISSDGTNEVWEVETNTLPNTYWYMSMVDEDSKPFKAVDIEMMSGTFNQWSAVLYPGGGYASFTFADAIGRDFLILDFYGNPGTQCILRFTVRLPDP